MFIMGRAHHGQLILFEISHFDQINTTDFFFALDISQIYYITKASML